MEITTDEDYRTGAVYLRASKALQDLVEDEFGPPVAAAYKAHKEAVGLRKRHLEALTKVEESLKRRMCAWIEHTERSRLSELEERRRAAQEINEREALQEALELEAEGRHEEAEEMLATALTPIALVHAGVPQLDGITRRRNWYAVVEDPMALIHFVSEHPEFVHLVAPVTKELNNLARAQKGLMSIPGVRAESKLSIAASGK